MTAAPLGERGSALLLMPAAVLIVLVLAAITVDLSLVHLARREAMAAAEGAANDAVTFGLDEAAYRRGEGYRLDPARVRIAVERALATDAAGERWSGPPRVEVLGSAVRITVVARVDYVFARALPGGRDHTNVTVTAEATPTIR